MLPSVAGGGGASGGGTPAPGAGAGAGAAASDGGPGALTARLRETRAYLHELRAMHAEGIIDAAELATMRAEALRLQSRRMVTEVRGSGPRAICMYIIK